MCLLFTAVTGLSRNENTLALTCLNKQSKGRNFDCASFQWVQQEFRAQELLCQKKLHNGRADVKNFSMPLLH
jgi:hypothetical protein